MSNGIEVCRQSEYCLRRQRPVARKRPHKLIAGTKQMQMASTRCNKKNYFVVNKWPKYFDEGRVESNTMSVGISNHRVCPPEA